MARAGYRQRQGWKWGNAESCIGLWGKEVQVWNIVSLPLPSFTVPFPLAFILLLSLLFVLYLSRSHPRFGQSSAIKRFLVHSAQHISAYICIVNDPYWPCDTPVWRFSEKSGVGLGL